MKPILFFALLCCLLASCGVPLRQLPQTCAELYPPKETVVVRDTIVHDTLHFPDFAFEYLDTTVCPPQLTDTLIIVKTVKKTVPLLVPVQIPRRDSLIYIRDVAEEKVLRWEVALLQKRLDACKLKMANSKKWFWAFVTVSVFFLLSVFRRRK